ncbi:MAG: hypothetical protein WAO12_00285 [Venatoribacter sp.]
MKLNKLLTFIGTAIITLPTLAQQSPEPNYHFSAAYLVAKSTQEIYAAIGGWVNSVSYEAYLSRFDSYGETNYHAQRAGAQITDYSPYSYSEDLGIFLYANQASPQFMRSGLGINYASGWTFNPQHRAMLGIDLMPEFLSADWNGHAALEYCAKAYWDYTPVSWVSIKAEYRYGGTVFKTQEFYRQFLAGVILRF